MSDCTYTFKGADGKEQKITGLSAFKSFLANGGLEQLRGEAFSFLPTSSNVRGMADKDTVAGTQAPTSAGDGSTGSATIEVDGVLRSTLNSNGKPIHPTREGIRNFWRWFGESKVVDSEGRPIVVFHGSDNDIQSFDPMMLGKNTGAASAKKGFFFAAHPRTTYAYMENGVSGTEAIFAAAYGWTFKTYSENVKKWQQEEGRPAWDKDVPFDWLVSNSDVASLRNSYKNRLRDLNKKSGGLMRRTPLSKEELAEKERIEDWLDDDQALVRMAQNSSITNDFGDMSAEEVDSYLNEHLGWKRAGANIMPVYLKIEFPAEFDDGAAGYREQSYSERIDIASNNKNDGLVIRNTADGFKSTDTIFVVFDPKNIKSASGNVGVFGINTNPNEPSASTGSDAVDALNKALLEQEGINNAFSASSFADNGLIAAFKKTFGVDVVPVKANTEEGKQFLGMNYGGKLYVNAENEHAGFVQIAGHELLHQIASDSPGIYNWFAGVAKDYMRSGAIERYGDLLRSQGANLDKDGTNQEILADFVGDALADKDFLQALADNNQSKFKMFVNRVVKWLGDVANKLSSNGFSSSEYFDDVNGLRGYLIGVLDAYSKTKSIPDSGVRFSRASAMLDKLSSENKIVGDSGREYSDKQREFFKGVGRDIDQKTAIGKALDYLRNDFWKKMAVGVVDQFRGLRDLGDNGQAYLLARLSKGTAGALDAFLHHGKLSIKDGVYDADQTGGFIDRLGVPLHGELDDFLWFVAANRAEKLSQQDRENLFTPEYIAAGKSLADGQTNFDYTIQSGPSKGKTTRNRAEVYADAHRVFNEFQKNALDIAEQSGLIDPESRKHWESEFYVPFYRVSEEDGEFIGAKMGKALVRQQAFKKLKGGTDKLNSDLLTNTLMNWSHLIEASAKNRAAKAALTAAEKTGAAHKADPGEKKTVWFMDGGQKVEYGVDDPFVMTAITSLEYAGMNNGIMGAMSKFKHMLTIGVTASPAFKVRNLIRDSIQAIGTSDLSYNPIKNIKEGYKLTDRNSQTYVSALASGGLIRFGTMLEGSESARVRQLIKSGVKDSNILDSEDKMRAFYDRYIEPGLTAYNELGNRSEEINRAALYDQLIKQGKSHAEAALQARDLMDFSMQGSFNTIRFLTQVTPFLNARLQGLYKLGRAAEKDPAKMATVIGACALASIALMMAYRDDDDWKRREDFDRDNFWWFKFGGEEFRLPKPFEVGAVASIAERGLEYMLDDEMTGERFGKVMSAMALNNLSMNPVPQMIKPIVDLYANKDSFTGRPIETMGMQRLEKTERYNGNTSMVARGLSNATAGALSPVEYDHLVRSYFGWLGSFVVGGADMVVRAGSDEPAKPTADYFKIATGGIVREAGTGGSRYVSQVYEQAAELEQAYGTYHHLLKDGKVAEAQEYAADNKDKLARYRQVESVKKAESTINQQIRAIERSNIDPDEKKTRVDALNKRKEDVAKRIAPGVTQ